MNKAPLNKFAITASDFDLEAFNEAVKDVRNTRKQVVDFGGDFEDTREKLSEAHEGLKKAMSDFNLDEITKLTAECKRLTAKLETTPVTKVQAFDLAATLEVGEKVSYAGIGSVSMAEETQPAVTDWEALYEYIKDNDAFYFLQRKINAAPFRELLSTGESLVGVSPIQVRKISVRKN